MAIELYWGSGSPFAWRVMLTLELKGLAYESKLLEFSKRDHKSPSYLKLNPRGKVPTLKDGDFVIYESIAIMAYLDRQYPEPLLFGKTPREAGLIWRTIAECEGYFARTGDKVVRPIFFGKGLENLEEIRLAAEIVHQEMKSFEAALAQSAWLVGEQITAADIAIFPLVQLILRAASKEAAQPFDLRLMPLSQNYPNLARWVRQIEALPGYPRTYPPHWRS
jgi:glutathione S-transferase